MKTYYSDSEEYTRALAGNYAKTVKGGEIISLSGDLGAGKTIFAKGFATGLGINEEITSPTFTVMNEYVGKNLNLYHYDAYRLKSGREAYEAGLCDYLGDKNSVCLIEWADNMKSALPENIVKIEIIYISETEREIKIYD